MGRQVNDYGRWLMIMDDNTPMHAFLYALPAILALLCKFVIVLAARVSPIRNRQTDLFFYALSASVVLNMAEVAIIQRFTPIDLAILGKLYFTAAFASIALLVHLSMEVSLADVNKPLNSAIPKVLYGVAVTLTGALWFTDYLVVGFAPFATYGITRVPGPAYFLVELFLVLGFLSIIGLSAFGVRRGRPQLLRIKSKFWLFATLPVAGVVIAVVAWLHNGNAPFNSLVVLPLVLVWLYAWVAYAVTRFRLFDLEFALPWSRLRRVKQQRYADVEALAVSLQPRPARELLARVADTLGCSVAIVGGMRPVSVGSAATLGQMPRDHLPAAGTSLLVEEAAALHPVLYKEMTEHGASAVVPLQSNGKRASWLVFGTGFDRAWYTRRDFSVLGNLFRRLPGVIFGHTGGMVGEATRDLRQRLLRSERERDEALGKVDALQAQLDKLGSRLAALEDTQSQGRAPVSPTSGSLADSVAAFERSQIERALAQADGNLTVAAKLLGENKSTLHYKVKRHGIVLPA